jgi:hypothetical protein
LIAASGRARKSKRFFVQKEKYCWARELSKTGVLGVIPEYPYPDEQSIVKYTVKRKVNKLFVDGSASEENAVRFIDAFCRAVAI